MVMGNSLSSFIPPILFGLCIPFTDMNAWIYFFLLMGYECLDLFFSGSWFNDFFSGSGDMNA
jgi:hypothetical protein